MTFIEYTELRTKVWSERLKTHNKIKKAFKQRDIEAVKNYLKEYGNIYLKEGRVYSKTLQHLTEKNVLEVCEALSEIVKKKVPRKTASNNRTKIRFYVVLLRYL